MEILEEIVNVVIEGDKDRVIAAAKKALAQNVAPMTIIKKGFTQEMLGVSPPAPRRCSGLCPHTPKGAPLPAPNLVCPP